MAPDKIENSKMKPERHFYPIHIDDILRGEMVGEREERNKRDIEEMRKIGGRQGGRQGEREEGGR